MRFDGLASTNFTIAKYLSRKNFVYYVDHPYTWRDYLSADKSSSTFRRRKSYFSWFSKAAVDHEQLRIIVPFPVLPINWLPEGKFYRSMLAINEKLVSNKIKRILKGDGINDYIFINSWNFHYPNIAQYLTPRLKIYHCVDPLITAYDKRHGAVSEKILVGKSDMVICTSKALEREKKLMNKHTYFVPNAADLVLKYMEKSTTEGVHPSLKKTAYPVIGYIGAVERRFDFDLLFDVITKNTAMNFVFIGPVSKDVVPEWFFEQPNVQVLPPVTYEEVASCIIGFDVCIIPFKKDEVSDTIFPLKLFEYLGMGKPVVSTEFNLDLKEFTGNTVVYAANANAYTEGVKTALLKGNEEIEERLQIAKENTWQQRVDQIAELIANHLEREETYKKDGR